MSIGRNNSKAQTESLPRRKQMRIKQDIKKTNREQSKSNKRQRATNVTDAGKEGSGLYGGSIRQIIHCQEQLKVQKFSFLMKREEID